MGATKARIAQHAIHKIIAERTHPRRSTVTPGEFVEISPDVFSVILSPNGSDAKKLMADLEELGVKDLPLKERIFAVSNHASPAPAMAFAAGGCARMASAARSARRASPSFPPSPNPACPGYDSSQWPGLVVPANTPRDIVNRLHRDVGRILSDGEI